MRFEESTRTPGKATAAGLSFALAGFSLWVGRTWDIQGVGFQVFAGGMALVSTLFALATLFRIVYPCTYILELSEERLRFGRIAPTDRTLQIYYRDVAKVIIDAEEGYVWVIDDQGVKHLITVELAISQKDFQDIKQIFDRVLAADRIIFRPFFGTEMFPSSSRCAN